MNHMLTHAERLLSLSRLLLQGVLFLFPLFFLPLALDPLEINKQSLLLLGTCAAAVLMVGALLLKKHARMTFSWIFLFPLVIGGAMIASASVSLAPYASWVGASGSEYASVLTWIGVSFLYYALTLCAAELTLQRTAFLSLISSAAIAGLIGCLSLVGVSLTPIFPSLGGASFNTVGTLNALAVFLCVMSLYAFGALLVGKVRFTKTRASYGVFALFALLFLETLFLLLALDYIWLFVLMALGCVTALTFVLYRPKLFPSAFALLLPAGFLTVSLLFGFLFPSPFRLSFPREVSVSADASRQIAEKTLQNHSALFGTGPGTYVINYAKFHPRSVNETDFWNTRFDRASSFVMTLTPTIGYVGVGLYLAFLFALFILALKQLTRGASDDAWKETFQVFLPWGTLAAASLLFPFNMTLLITFLVLSALLSVTLHTKERSFRFDEQSSAKLFATALLVLCAFLLFVGIFLTTGRYVAEMAYADAVRADHARTETTVLVQKLDRAATLNRWNDDYMRNLSVALRLRVTDELKTITPDAPVSETTRSYIQALVAASVNASVRATELAPNTVSNWLTRAEMYRSLAGLVDASSSFALQAYEKAIALEPLNPNHWNEMGKTHLVIADSLEPLTLSNDAMVSLQAKNDRAAALRSAEESFVKATELKSNFAPAHYQLALVYEKSGRLNEAISQLESVQRYNTTDIGVGFSLGQFYLARAKEGDFAKAKQVFLRVIALAPTYSDAHWFLASAHESLGEKDLAIKELETVLRLNPDSPIAAARLQKLKNSP